MSNTAARKSILLVYLGKQGGPAAFTYELARGFSKIGCSVSAVLSSEIQCKESWDEETVIKKCYIYTGNTQKILAATIKLELSERGRIKREFRNAGFDYVVYTMPHPWSLRVGTAVRAKRHIMFCHDPVPHSSALKVYGMLNGHLLKKCDDIFVLTKSFISIAAERYHKSMESIHFVPHGRMSIYKKPSYKETVQDDDKLRFLFFGNISGYKGIDVLAQAYKRFCEAIGDCQNIQLTVAGRGDFSPYAAAFHELQNVTVDNRFIPDEEVSGLFSAPNTVLILPYLDATQSGVIPIAMEFGVPVIASDTGGLREQLNNGCIGSLFPRADAAALCETMRLYFSNRNLFAEQRKLMSAYLQELNWDRIAARMIQQITNSSSKREYHAQKDRI